MSDQSVFADSREVQKWLESQTSQVRAQVFCRMALREVSALVSESDNFDEFTLKSFRAILLAGSHGFGTLKFDTPAFGARDFSSVNIFVGKTPFDAAFHLYPRTSFEQSGRAVTAAASAAEVCSDRPQDYTLALSRLSNYFVMRNEFEGALISDAANSKSSWLRSSALWSNITIPSIARKQHSALLARFDLNPKWSFWRNWYVGMWDGTFDNWDLATDVARIPGDVWNEGLGAVADAIREIEAEHMAAQARVSEKLALNESTLMFSAIPAAPSNIQRLSRHLSRVEDALEDIIALGGGNGLTANTAEFRIIKRLVSKYGNDPERVAFDLTDVNKSIQRQIDVGEYADDEPLRLLQAASTACVAFVCDTHDDVAQELARGLDPEPQAVSEQDALVLEEAWQVSVQMLEDGAAQTTLEDRAEILAGQVVDAQSDPMPEWSPGVHAMRSIVLRRQISRLWQQAQGLATVPELARLYDSEHSKALGYVGRAGGALGTLYAAILVLGRIRGSG